MDEATAEKKFEAWMTEKSNKIQGKVDALTSDSDNKKEAILVAERAINEARVAEIESS